MRLSQLFFVTMTALLLASVSQAEEIADSTISSPTEIATPEVTEPEAATPDVTTPEGGEDFAWDQFDDPEFDPTAVAAVPADAAATEGTPNIELVAETGTASKSSTGIVLGPQGVDDQGRSGRLHTVATGDTLWDLSAAYLGTPWVWPSVWIDNDSIANPHVISPGDKIWITANEMRVVTEAEAESFLEPIVADETVAAIEVPAAAEAMPELIEDPTLGADIEPVAALEGIEDEASTLDAFPVAIPTEVAPAQKAGRQITIARRDSFGFVSSDALNGASSIVESESERTFLSAGDRVYLGMGEGDAEVGDQFTIFQVVEEVRDVETNRLLGHHVENLGWVEVISLAGDSSIGQIRQSYAEIRRGASVVAREKLARRVTLRTTPDAVNGHVVFLPSERTLMADGGYVYLNRGEFHGVEVGSELEVFDEGDILNERERRIDVRTPDKSVATLVVVTVEPDSSVAFVLNSSREIAVGDAVRPVVSRNLAQR